MPSACLWHALLTPVEIPALSVWFLPRVRKGFHKAFKMGSESLDPLLTLVAHQTQGPPPKGPGGRDLGRGGWAQRA